LPIAVQEQPDLILLDIFMPLPRWHRNLETVARTADDAQPPGDHAHRYDTRDRLEDSIAAGADDFLSKPINLTELHVRVGSMLKVKGMTDEVERLETYINFDERDAPRSATQLSHGCLSRRRRRRRFRGRLGLARQPLTTIPCCQLSR